MVKLPRFNKTINRCYPKNYLNLKNTVKWCRTRRKTKTGRYVEQSQAVRVSCLKRKMRERDKMSRLVPGGIEKPDTSKVFSCTLCIIYAFP